jgi:hypothetical protein
MSFFNTQLSSKEIQAQSIQREGAGAHHIATTSLLQVSFHFSRGTIPYFQRLTELRNAGPMASLGKQFPEESNFQLVEF